MKLVKHILLSFLLSITIFISLLSIVLFNTNFLKKTLREENYYKDNISFKNDLEGYINKRFSNKYQFKDINNKKEDKIFSLKYLHISIYIIYFINLLLIIVTGTIFNKTKNSHNLSTIAIISFIFLLIIYGILYLYNYKYIFFRTIIPHFLKYLLVIDILVLMWGVYSKMKKRGLKKWMKKF